MKKIRVAVLMGGENSEREVSLMTGKEIIKYLNREKYEIVEINLPRNLKKVNKTIDLALIALHGKGGEDGAIQGYLETMGIKYTGSGLLASAIGMNKKIFRDLMMVNKLVMPKLVIKAPCVVKPVNGGSSVGVTIVKSQNELEKAVNEAKKWDREVIIEEYIEGIEVSCGVLGNEVLPIIEIIPKNDFFDYESKYTRGMSDEICPARLSKEMTIMVQEETLKVFKIIGGKGYARADYIIKENKIYLLEINTLPGLTPSSLLPKEAGAYGYSFSKMLDKIIKLALE
ncbi:MAG TPA: D-alanine--D-alanine ligase [Candidatus Woesebacteria bacterium]|nr:D-alanine--D-alanine ligase [Candidatus Woesebacteria bacterium]HPR99486.1 D-alanine--D-alanine ligase [Candidatus Woesebacteria bacterium]